MILAKNELKIQINYSFSVRNLGNEPPHGLTNICFRYTDSTISPLSKSEFQASSLPLWLYRPVCVGPGRKPKLLVFSCKGSNLIVCFTLWVLWYDYFIRRFTSEPTPEFNKWAATRENRFSGFPTRSDTNRAVQSQKMARSLKFRI